MNICTLGLRGWFPVIPPTSLAATFGTEGPFSREDADTSHLPKCVGGLELTMTFPSKQHGEVVLEQVRTLLFIIKVFYKPIDVFPGSETGMATSSGHLL